jgi:hypothetical protein
VGGAEGGSWWFGRESTERFDWLDDIQCTHFWKIVFFDITEFLPQTATNYLDISRVRVNKALSADPGVLRRPCLHIRYGDKKSPSRTVLFLTALFKF